MRGKTLRLIALALPLIFSLFVVLNVSSSTSTVVSVEPSAIVDEHLEGYTCSPTGTTGGWTNPTYAMSDDGLYATCDTDGIEQIYTDFNFPTLPSVELGVGVGLKCYTPEANISEWDRIEVEVTNDGGSTWGPVHTHIVTNETGFGGRWIYVGDDFDWTPSMLSNANFKVKIRYTQVGAATTAIYLDWIPAKAGSTFTVDINVSDVTDLSLAQVGMRYDPWALDVATAWEGDFMSGETAFGWHGEGYADETDPYNLQEEGPSSWYPPSDPFGLEWQWASYTEYDDGKWASCTEPDAEQTAGNYGFLTGALTEVSRLRVRVHARLANVTYPETEPDYLDIKVSNDGGTSWGPVHEAAGIGESETVIWVDVTYDFAWTPSMLTDANFNVSMTYRQFGPAATTLYVDYLGAEVTDTLSVYMPSRAHDGSYDLPAIINYGGRTGSFAVTDFGHNLPSGPAVTPADETAIITQVDMHMRYEANASGVGDEYRIGFLQSLQFPTPIFQELEGWTSSATTLANYTWTNVAEPDNSEWTWDEIDYLELMVETNKVGGDLNANFYEYEAWLEVHYFRQTFFGFESFIGECALGVEILGKGIYGASGSGWLYSVKFYVTDPDSGTILCIDNIDTKMFQPGPYPFPPNPIEFTAKNGFFANDRSVWILGDVDGDLDVDASDLQEFSEAYGSKVGDANWDPFCNFDCDGEVNAFDLFILSRNYTGP